MIDNALDIQRSMHYRFKSRSCPASKVRKTSDSFRIRLIILRSSQGFGRLHSQLSLRTHTFRIWFFRTWLRSSNSPHLTYELIPSELDLRTHLIQSCWNFGSPPKYHLFRSWYFVPKPSTPRLPQISRLANPNLGCKSNNSLTFRTCAFQKFPLRISNYIRINNYLLRTRSTLRTRTICTRK